MASDQQTQWIDGYAPISATSRTIEWDFIFYYYVSALYPPFIVIWYSDF